MKSSFFFPTLQPNPARGNGTLCGQLFSKNLVEKLFGFKSLVKGPAKPGELMGKKATQKGTQKGIGSFQYFTSLFAKWSCSFIFHGSPWMVGVRSEPSGNESPPSWPILSASPCWKPSFHKQLNCIFYHLLMAYHGTYMLITISILYDPLP